MHIFMRHYDTTSIICECQAETTQNMIFWKIFFVKNGSDVKNKIDVQLNTTVYSIQYTCDPTVKNIPTPTFLHRMHTIFVVLDSQSVRMEPGTKILQHRNRLSIALEP